MINVHSIFRHLLSRKIPSSPSALRANFRKGNGSRFIIVAIMSEIAIIFFKWCPNLPPNNSMEIKLTAVPSIVIHCTLILFPAHKSRILDNKQFKSSAFTLSIQTYLTGYLQCPWKLTNIETNTFLLTAFSWGTTIHSS